jgi:2-polyprenyl-6-hydroxyphenyl methylase/3-demethylubiquinone-9 3-methyltransferase
MLFCVCITTHTETGKDSRSWISAADNGCGAGTLSTLLAERGHHIHGLDVNEPLVSLARERAQSRNLDIDYRIGSATELPWETESMDICISPELLEHVPEWSRCLDEFCRILKPGGILYLSTNNVLCPKQQEFNLPLYSWYPAPLKRYYERLAKTTRPQLAGYATYPAVNWFTFYSLRKELRSRGFTSCDRFDIMRTDDKSGPARIALQLVRKIPVLRFIAHVFTPYTVVVAVKNG